MEFLRLELDVVADVAWQLDVGLSRSSSGGRILVFTTRGRCAMLQELSTCLAGNVTQ